MSIFGGGTHTVAKTPTRAMGIDLQGAQYGAPVPVVFGQNKVAGNVIWYGDFKATAHTQKQQGGKGGGGGQTSTSYTYSASFELGLCEGTATIVNVYQGASTVNLSSSGGIAFNGAVGQAPWSHLSGNAALGYSGTAIAAFQNLQLGSSASLPNFNFEVAARNQFGGGIVDANPADILTAICTDTQIGVQFNALGDLTAFKNYCTAAGLFFSPVYKTQNPAQQSLDDLFKYANSAPYFSEGVLKVVPYGDATITGNGVTYTPNNTAIVDLGRDDFITNGPGDPVTIHRVGPADAMNLVRVEYKDRANTYHTGAVVASIDQDVVGTGSRAEQSESVDMITTAPVAKLVAQNLLQRTYYIRNTYEFQLSWRYCYLEPMDIVTLTDANTDLYLTPVRITEISEDEHGLLSVVAEEFPDGVSHASTYSTQPNAGTTVDPNADPGPVDGPYLFRGPGFLVSNNQPEIWCALSGNDPLWAGCDVYISHDGTSYTYLATASGRAAYGVLSNTLAANADPDTTGAPNVLLNGPVQLLGGTQADADQFVTLAMIDNEIIAYQTATLASGPSYTLGYLRRGGYGSAIAAHAANAPFVRLDENIIRLPVDPSQIGQTVYLKFVSFNVFGKGGRTLADETAYTYVVGTNIELPDVPVTPSSFAAKSVADGVSLTWDNPNPAAVGCTSIEYATASAGPWTVLAQVGPTHTSFAHHFTDGATYYYRARSRGPLVSAGFSAYTATVSNAGVNVGAISDNANTSLGQVTQLPVINGGFDMTPTGYGWTADANTGWTIDTANNTPGVGPNSAMHAGGTGNGAYRNNGLAACQPGQVYKAQGLIKAVGADGACYVYISWCNAAGAEIGSTAGNQVTGTTTAGSYVVGTAPAGTVFARTCLATGGQTVGTYYVDNVLCSQYPSHMGEVPDGGGRYAVHQVDGNGLALVDFSQAGHANKNLDYIANTTTAVKSSHSIAVGSQLNIDNSTFQLPVDATGKIPGWSPYATGARVVYQSSGPAPAIGAQYLSVYAGTGGGGGQCDLTFHPCPGDVITIAATFNAISGISSSVLVAFFTSASAYISQIAVTSSSASWVAAVGSGVVPASTAYAKVFVTVATAGNYVLLNRVSVTVNDVRIAGSGARVGDMRNLSAAVYANYGAAWNGLSLSYSATSTSATISASAATLQAGGNAISYNAGSVSVSGSAGTTVTYYLYYDDPGLIGGSQTLNATTSQVTSTANDGRARLGSVSVTFPSSGTSSGGGTVNCPQVDELVIRRAPDGSPERIRAGDVIVGDNLLLSSGRWGYVSHSQPATVPGVRVVGADGSTITCSDTAPLETAEGPCVVAPLVKGLPLKHRTAGVMRVADVIDAGLIDVQHITCEDDCFWVGEYSHHNLKP